MSKPIAAACWPNGAKAAISLTYDGGLPEHLLLVQPLLGTFGFKGTFYLSATAFLENPRLWSGMAQSGHEIGNHSLYGVCGPRGELSNWTLEMVDDDLLMTEALLRDHVPGNPKRSFAYPGDNPVSAEGSYEPVVESHFEWARSAQDGMNHVVFCNPQSLLTTATFGLAGPALVRKAEEALALGAWAIFVFESFSGGIETWESENHEMLLRHLSRRGDSFYVAPVREIAGHVTRERERMTVR